MVPKALAPFLPEDEAFAELGFLVNDRSSFNVLPRLLECTLGLECSVELQGYRLNESNGLVVITNGTCGDGNASVANDTWKYALSYTKYR